MSPVNILEKCPVESPSQAFLFSSLPLEAYFKAKRSASANFRCYSLLGGEGSLKSKSLNLL